MKRLHTIPLLVLLLALGLGISSASAEGSTAPAAACATTAAFLVDASVPAGPALEPLFASPPVCNPFCVTSQCTKHSDCTAAPNGRCNFACPQVGCCVYN